MPQLTHTQKRHLTQFFVESIRRNPQLPVVISEGDSWFSYPAHPNLIDHLDDQVGRRMSLLRLEDSGDELLGILSPRGVDSLSRLMQDHRPNVLLMSGGGNDIVGPELVDFVAARGAGFDEQKVATQAFEDILPAMRSAYQNLIAARDAVAPSCIIVTHGYGDVIPSGKKTRFLGLTAGPWMKPFLKARGYADDGEQRTVMRTLLGRFNAMLDTLTGPRFVKVDLSSAISDDEWHDEIHPTRNAFGDAARVVRTKLRELFPGKF